MMYVRDNEMIFVDEIYKNEYISFSILASTGISKIIQPPTSSLLSVFPMI